MPISALENKTLSSLSDDYSAFLFPMCQEQGAVCSLYTSAARPGALQSAGETKPKQSPEQDARNAAPHL